MSSEIAILAEKLSKTYGGGLGRSPIKALVDLDLEVPHGEIFGLLGPNGAGKTTLVKTLLGIVKPTLGAASLFGTPISRPAARRRTGYLPEDHRFPGYLTGERALDFYGALSGMTRAERQQKTDQALDAVGLLKWKKTKSRKYSKGMKQRLGIAQAIFHDPDLVFLDEPTDGVDPVGRRDIRALIQDLNQRGKTVFINSHLLSEVEMVCHRIIILHGGCVVKEGSIEELTESEGEYTFIVRGDLTPLDEELKSACMSYSRVHEGFKAVLKEEKDVDRVVDLLRGKGLGIRSIIPVKVSLEDVLIRIIESDREGGAE
jgi:ABC-2 type transport system ATP-binding protein